MANIGTSRLQRRKQRQDEELHKQWNARSEAQRGPSRASPPTVHLARTASSSGLKTGPRSITSKRLPQGQLGQVPWANRYAMEGFSDSRKATRALRGEEECEACPPIWLAVPHYLGVVVQDERQPLAWDLPVIKFGVMM